MQNYTPEEYETIENCFGELKLNFKYYSTLFGIGCLGFTYWQRQYVPRKFYFYAGAVALSLSSVASMLKTSWYFVEQMDRLGEEYELSRIVKQDIFDTRPDMDTSMRA